MTTTLERNDISLIGRGSTDSVNPAPAALQEIHIFILPLNPDQATVERYNKLVYQWNLDHPDVQPMKPCYLALIFRDADGKDTEVRVMQSARYVRCNSTSEVVEMCHADAKFFTDNAFQVVREKVEASAYGIDGVPINDDETQTSSTKGKYFEFHINVCRKDATDIRPITDTEIDELKSVSTTFGVKYNCPVPLSFNKNKDQLNEDGQGHQRFLNLRFRNMGINTIKPLVKAVEDGINNDTHFRVRKTISEYVWYDTYPAMDKGWIDF